MTEFTYQVVLVGTDGLKSSLNFDLGDFAEADAGADFLAALNAANQIRGALVDVTDANVTEESLRHVVSQDNQLPASADVFEEALVSTHLNAPAEAEKIHNLRIPAPIIGMFEGTTGTDRDIVDKNNALLVQYVQQVSQHSYVSDGEQVNTAAGTNGIKRGYRNIRKRKLGR